jgi:hypothetical protein
MLSGTFAGAENKSDLYYQIDTMSVTPVIEKAGSFPTPVMGQCDDDAPAQTDDIHKDLDDTDIILDKIINIGKKIWALVDSGRPVLNVKTDVAHALPVGVKCWSDLENWQAPRSQAWKVTYNNKLGGKVVEFVYRVSYIAGGQYKGQGHYVTQATMAPAEIYVAWGYKFDVVGSVPSVFNIGSTKSPVAGMQMNLKWTVDTVMNHHEQDVQFYINGLGEMQKMQNGELVH